MHYDLLVHDLMVHGTVPGICTCGNSGVAIPKDVDRTAALLSADHSAHNNGHGYVSRTGPLGQDK